MLAFGKISADDGVSGLLKDDDFWPRMNLALAPGEVHSILGIGQNNFQRFVRQIAYCVGGRYETIRSHSLNPVASGETRSVPGLKFVGQTVLSR